MISSYDPMPFEKEATPPCSQDNPECKIALVTECYGVWAECRTHDRETSASFAREIPYNCHLQRSVLLQVDSF